FGTDSFTYMLSDGEDASVTKATATVNVTSVNDAPVANSDVFVILSDRTIEVNAANGLLANDTDIEGDALTASLVSQPAHGSVAVNANGSLTYTANEGFTGTDTFTYKANDGKTDSAVGTATVYVGTSPLLITEFLVANATGVETRVKAAPDDRFRGDPLTPDWIEIQNTTNASFDLSGFHLTDSRNDKTKWAFPAGTTLAAGEYMVVYASRESISDPALDETGRLHTNFKLQPEGEYLALTTPDGGVLHEYGPNYPNQRPDISYGLGADNTPTYFMSPTMGAANGGETRSGIANDTSFSIDRGYFTEPFQVEISTTEEDGKIYFTLDGSEPSPENGTLYSAPIQITTTTNLRAVTYKDGLLPSLIDSQTYVFPAHVLLQSGEGIESATWGDSGPDWEMDPEIVNNADPNIRVTAEDLMKLPTVSLTTDWDWFFGQQGIYPWDPGRGIGVARDGYEIPVSFEYFDGEGHSTQSYSTVQIVGGSSPDRNVNDWKTDKLSMRVKFTEDVGKSSLDYPVFGPDATDSFTTLVVDARLNNVWSYSGGSDPNGQRGRALYFRDQLAADYENAAGGLAPHGFKTHVYINGVYWGLHTLHERPDDNFAASYLGGDNDDYDVMKHTQSDVIAGSSENYLALLDLVREDMEVQENYEAVAEKLDIEQFVSYMLTNQYGGNADWAHHNWYASFNRVDPEGKWRFHSWDAEKILENLNDNVVTKNDRGGPTEIHFRLTKNPEYLLLYQDIAHRELFHGGTFTPETSAKLFSYRADQIGTAIRAESARWGDNQRSNPYTIEDWQNNVDRYLNTHIPQRTEVFLNQLVRRDLWPDETLQPPMLTVGGTEQYGGFVTAGTAVALSAAEGTVYFTTDGSDPRVAGGAVSATATAYGSPIAINGTTNVKARLQKADGSWSPLSDATFITNVSATPDSLRITEIHYHPADPTDAEVAAGYNDPDDFEFIEIFNKSDATIDLTDVRFLQAVEGANVEGIKFNFADGAIASLGPGQYAIVVEDLDAFRFRYGDGLPVAGQWSGGLGNADEPIRLVAGDDTIHEFIYLDDWVPATDGTGPSLQIVNVNGDLSAWETAEGWRASTTIGGTPGADDSGRVPGDSNGDGLFNSSDLVLVFQAGEYEDGIDGNSTFEEGDWNGDGDFTTSDFVYALQFGHYEKPAALKRVLGIAGALDRTAVVGPADATDEQAPIDEASNAKREVELDAQLTDSAFADLELDLIDASDRMLDLNNDDEVYVA
ncbi:MAG: lamin tail domain-containing protein, partial [Planctomycetales bacterium]|nr:lamin tail domain-containing protein [Planctomycetales bacterium]